jgi:hypothetical protein
VWAKAFRAVCTFVATDVIAGKDAGLASLGVRSRAGPSGLTPMLNANNAAPLFAILPVVPPLNDRSSACPNRPKLRRLRFQ